MNNVKYIVSFCVVVLTSYLAWNSYHYFLDMSCPELVVSGIENGKFYSGDLSCSIASSKRGEVTVYLDSQPLTSHYKMGKRGTEYPFSIPTQTVTNGVHTLKVEFSDATFYKNRCELTRTFTVDNMPIQTSFVKADSDYKVFQGRTLHVQFQVNKEIATATVHALANNYPCFMESPQSSIYECFIPISCEESPNEYLFTVDIADHVGNKLSVDNKFQIVMYPFKKQTLHVSSETVKREKEIDLSLADLEKTLQALAQNSPQEKLWKGAFCTPLDIAKVTCDFGTVRTSQERGRYAHKALDVINAPRSVIWATQDGVIAIKDRYAYSGNTVVIDHGCGVFSLFYHLDSFADIAVGQKVKKGNPIGTLGKTGYATGYHLHWELRVNNIAVDPMQWTKANF